MRIAQLKPIVGKWQIVWGREHPSPIGKDRFVVGLVKLIRIPPFDVPLTLSDIGKEDGDGFVMGFNMKSLQGK